MGLYQGDKLLSSTGKSPAAYAKDAGYAGTDDNFYTALADMPDHISDQENPHGVTAEQVGAYTKEAISTLLANKAPAGYGLGTKYGKPITDANTALEAGWYRYGGSCINVPSDSNFQYGAILTVPMDDYSTNQIAFSERDGDKSVLLAFRKTIDGGATFGEWEYLNPYMELGKEYRTTERYLGKPVYVKVIDVGALPNADQKMVSHGIDNIDKFVSVYGRRYSTDTGETNIPYETYNSKCGVYANASSVFVYCSTNASTSTGYVTLKYTKTTD